VAGYPVPGPTLDRVVDVAAASALALEAAIGLAGLAGRRIGVEEGHLSAAHARVVARHATTEPLAGELEALRRVKDARELPLIRAAVAANDVGFEAARHAIAAGVTELAVQDAIVAAIQGAVGVPIHLTDATNGIVSGPRTEGAVGPPTPRALERGDLVIIDINPVIRGYKGDTTRTYCVGRPTGEQRRLHDALVRALEAAERVARPGVRACDVYAALVAPMIAAGLGAGVRNHGGHAMGLEHLERPYIIPGDEMPLAEGMILTLEPGLYLPGIGARLEDNYLVTADGLELLSHFPRELTVC
jgi:Xaa-Pro dipeptidase